MLKPSTPQLFQKDAHSGIKLMIAGIAACSLMLIDHSLNILGGLRSSIAHVLYPVQKTLVFFPKTWENVSQYGRTQIDLVQENKQFQEQVIRLTMQSNQTKQLTQENTQLKQLLQLKTQNPFNIELTEVLYHYKTAFEQNVSIDKGASHGLKSGQAVINEQGLIGQIKQLHTYHADLNLLHQRDVTVPVQVLRTGSRSIVSGNGLPNQVELKFMPASSDLKVGDLLVTSGLDAIYPAGIPVAVVKSINNASQDSFLQVSAEPVVKHFAYRYVMVIKK